MYIVSTVCTCICTFMEIDFDTYDDLEFPFYVRSLYSCRAVALCDFTLKLLLDTDRESRDRL